MDSGLNSLVLANNDDMVGAPPSPPPAGAPYSGSSLQPRVEQQGLRQPGVGAAAHQRADLWHAAQEPDPDVPGAEPGPGAAGGACSGVAPLGLFWLV